MPKRTIPEYVEGLPRSAAFFRVRVGKGRDLETVALVALRTVAGAVEEAEKRGDEEGVSVEVCERRALADVLAELADDNGWPEDHPTLRIHSYAKAGKEGRSYQRTDKTPVRASKGAPPEAALADALVRMVDRVGTIVEVLNHTLENQGQQIVELSNANMELRRTVVEKEADAIDAQLELVMENIKAASGGDDETKAQVRSILGQLASFLTGGDVQPDPPAEGQPDA